MKKTTLREKTRYHFDNLMAKGMSAQVGMLLAVTLLVTVGFGVFVYVSYPQDVYSVFRGIWTTFMHMIDGGTITADEGSFLYMTIMFVVTMFGLIVTATMIGIINESLSSKMENLRKGNSHVLEKDHTIILGFDTGIYTIIENLMIANENEKGRVIVIMDEFKSKAEMEDDIASWLIHKKKSDKEKGKYRRTKYTKTKIICRNGDIANIKAVSMCSPQDAKSIIVNCADDFMTVKAILAAAGNITDTPEQENKKGQKKRSKPHIVAAVKDEDYKATATLAGKINNGNRVVNVIYVDEFISRVIAYTGRQPGISKVLTEFLGFEGSEIYFEPITPTMMAEVNSQKGLTVYQANCRLKKSVILGLKRKLEAVSGNDKSPKPDFELILNPDKTEKIKPDDELIVLEDDNGDIVKQYDAKWSMSAHLEDAPKSVATTLKKNTLILGYSSKIPLIIKESKKYLEEGSEFTVVFDIDYQNQPNELFDQKHREFNKIVRDIKNLKIEPQYKDLYKGDDYQELLSSNGKIDSIMILSDYNLEPEVNDAKMLGLLLRVRAYQQNNKNSVNYSITTEMIKCENKELAIIKESKDFIVSEDITNKIIAQVSEQPHLQMFFDELLAKTGPEIYVHNFKEYKDRLNIDKNGKFNYTEAVRATAEKQQTLIGFQVASTGECSINPEKNSLVEYHEDDTFIVLEAQERDKVEKEAKEDNKELVLNI